MDVFETQKASIQPTLFNPPSPLPSVPMTFPHHTSIGTYAINK